MFYGSLCKAQIFVHSTGDTGTSESAASTLGIQRAQVAKSIALMVKGVPWLAVLRGDCKVDLNKARSMPKYYPLTLPFRWKANFGRALLRLVFIL